MLNIGAVYGAATGGLSGWVYGTLHGPYMQETLDLINVTVGTFIGQNPTSIVGQVGVLVSTGVLLGACVGTAIVGRTQY